MATTYKHGDITERIIGTAYKVYSTLGFGFLEKVYENALILELRKAAHSVTQQAPIEVLYEGEVVGQYAADLIVDDKVIVEVKAVRRLDEVHEVQLVNYLKATGIEVGLLLNFGREIAIKRRIFTR